MLQAGDDHELLDRVLVDLAERARPVPSLVPDDAAHARAARIAQLALGQTPAELEIPAGKKLDARVFRAVDEARKLSARCAFGDLYRERLDELELDFAILDAWGDARRVRPLCARRYGRGDEPVELGHGTVSLYELASELLRQLPVPESQGRTLPAWDERGPSAGRVMLDAARGLGLTPELRVEPRLASLAATGERTLFLSARRFSLHEARRLAAHEVYGHLVAAANARLQRLRLLRVGCAGSFADQEGLALYLEELCGLMCGERLRTLAARVIATRHLHDGASFGEAARSLYEQHGFAPESAVILAERAFRGGGLARDAGYLLGYVRVRQAVQGGLVTLAELWAGRTSLRALPQLRVLAESGLVAAARYAPSLERMRALLGLVHDPDTRVQTRDAALGHGLVAAGN
jgi:uncharacterized protein (TIGR02421 family)